MHRGLALAILLVLVLVALFAPLKIPYELVSVGSVMPAEEWLLVQDAGGSLSASQQNFKTGMISHLATWQFERGDLSGMEVTVRPDTFGQVICGDTVVRMYSSIIQQQILELDNQLKIKESLQNALLTGEKPPIVQEAESKLVFAKEALALREKEFAIAEKLLADGVIAQIEFTRSKNALDLAKIDVQTAEKALDVANTGVKIQTVEVNSTEIVSLRKQLDFLRTRNAGYVIRAPFNGAVAPIREPGQVLILQKISEYIVKIPIKAEDMMFIPDSVKISVSDPLTGKTYPARLLKKEPQTQVLSGRSVAFLQAVVFPERPGERVTIGLTANCLVKCDELNQRQYLGRILKFSLSAN